MVIVNGTGNAVFSLPSRLPISMNQVKHIITDAITPSEYYALMNEAQMELLHVATSQNVELSKTLDLLRFSLALMRAAEADEEDE